MSALASYDVTASCHDAECGWAWTGSPRDARDRASAHEEMYGHSTSIGDVIDRGRAALDRMDAGEPQQPPSGVALCKTCGERPAAWKAGPYAKLCTECAEPLKAAQSARSAAAYARRPGRKPKPAPVAQETPAPKESPNGVVSLDALAENVRQARQAATSAYEAWEAAVARLSEELAA